MIPNYWLVGGVPTLVRPEDAEAFDAWYDDFENRRVVEDRVDDVRISTVFLVRPVGTDGEGRPLLYETLVEGMRSDGEDLYWHYANVEGALLGHTALVSFVRLQVAKRRAQEEG